MSVFANELTRGLLATESIVALYDPDDVLRVANAAYERRFLRGRALPIAFAEVLRHGFVNDFGVYISSGDVESFLVDVSHRRRSEPFRAFEVDTVEGEWIWMTETLVDGWLLSIGSIITRLKDDARIIARDRDLARLAADTDALTGAFNRRRILEIADRVVSNEKPCSLAIIDLDHFKRINDDHGHLVGDQVLAHFADYCTSSIRPSDHFGRYGGEEFLLVLFDTPREVAAAILERMRMHIPAIELSSTRSLAYTFSAGIAEVTAGDTLATALARADSALYRAKASGRNAVV